MANDTALTTKEMTISERFTQAVVKEYESRSGGVKVTEKQRELIQRYFVEIDRSLAKAELDREKKNEFRTADKKVHTAYTWGNVKMEDLALDVYTFSSTGLDMSQDNFLFAIPYEDKKNKKIKITLMRGYNGIIYLATKYALIPHINVVIELVYSNDVFNMIKKDANNPIETYEFRVTNPFDRGEIIGGFGYIEFDNPTKNKLITLSKKEIDKRKPQYASTEFWGGEKDVWENKKKTGKTEYVEGWYKDMALKTVKREVYGTKNIPLDPDKVGDLMAYIEESEIKAVEILAEQEAEEKANQQLINMDDYEVLPDEPKKQIETMDELV